MYNYTSKLHVGGDMTGVLYDLSIIMTALSTPPLGNIVFVIMHEILLDVFIIISCYAI